jgi:hypothetical protein
MRMLWHRNYAGFLPHELPLLPQPAQRLILQYTQQAEAKLAEMAEQRRAAKEQARLQAQENARQQQQEWQRQDDEDLALEDNQEQQQQHQLADQPVDQALTAELAASITGQYSQQRLQEMLGRLPASQPVGQDDGITLKFSNKRLQPVLELLLAAAEGKPIDPAKHKAAKLASEVQYLYKRNREEGLKDWSSSRLWLVRIAKAMPPVCSNASSCSSTVACLQLLCTLVCSAAWSPCSFSGVIKTVHNCTASLGFAVFVLILLPPSHSISSAMQYIAAAAAARLLLQVTLTRTALQQWAACEPLLGQVVRVCISDLADGLWRLQDNPSSSSSQVSFGVSKPVPLLSLAEGRGQWQAHELQRLASVKAYTTTFLQVGGN